MVLTDSKDIADFYEECLKEYNNPKAVSNWVMGELLRILNERGISAKEVRFPPSHLAKLIMLADNSVVSVTAAKQVFEAMFESGKEPGTLVKELELEQISDESIISETVKKVIADNPKSAEDYKSGKGKALDFLIGRTMKALKGKGNPKIINKIIKSVLDEMI